MARMAGDDRQSWCPYCHKPPDLDCPDRGKSKRQVRQRLKQELQEEWDEYSAEHTQEK